MELEININSKPASGISYKKQACFAFHINKKREAGIK
jgi:hypothetical protein